MASVPRPRRLERSGIAFAAIGSVVIFGPLLYLAWPRADEPAADEPSPGAPARPDQPEPAAMGIDAAAVDREASLLFQPVLVWADDSVTVQGTGFTVEHPRGTFAVTSSCFVVPSEIPLRRVAFGSLPGLDKLGTVREAWGPMGPCASDSADDMRDDYLVMPIEAIAGLQRLQLDPRDELPVGEAVWLPDKSDATAVGHVVRTGRITRSSLGVIEVALDQPITLESQAGSPVLSQVSNRVLGILAGASSEAGERLYLAPASVLRAVMDDEAREAVPLTEALVRWIPLEGDPTEP